MRLSKILQEIKTGPLRLIIGSEYLMKMGNKNITVKYKSQDKINKYYYFTWGIGKDGNPEHGFGMSEKKVQEMLKNGNLKPINNESSIDSRFTTNQTSHDPDTRTTSWDVSYTPDFTGLIRDINKLIRYYKKVLNKNKLDGDLTFLKNLQSLEDFKINLTYLIKAKYPNFRDDLDEIKTQPKFSIEMLKRFDKYQIRGGEKGDYYKGQYEYTGKNENGYQFRFSWGNYSKYETISFDEMDELIAKNCIRKFNNKIQEIKTQPKLDKLIIGRKYKMYFEDVIYADENGNKWHEFIYKGIDTKAPPENLYRYHNHMIEFLSNNEMIHMTEKEIQELIKKGEIRYG